MKTQIYVPRRQRGIAMLVAILLVAIGTILAAAIAYENAMSARRANATLDFDEALLIGQGAEALAAFGLQQTFRNSGSGTGTSGKNGTPGTNGATGANGTTGLGNTSRGSGAAGAAGGTGGQTQEVYPGQPWAQPVGPIEVVPGVLLEATLEDLQGRFNLNWLVDPNTQAGIGGAGTNLGGQNGNPTQTPTNQPATGQNPQQGTGSTALGARVAFNHLLELTGVDPKWTDMIVDWIDSNQMPEPQGAEDSAYLSQNPPYLTANQYLVSTTELLALPGFTRENYAKLAPYIAALPPDTKLNICTAPGIVLDAFKGTGREWSDQDALDKNRASAAGCFPTQQGYSASVEDPNAKLFMQNQAGVTSKYFRLSSLITIGTAEFNLYSLLLVDNNGYFIHPIQRSFSPD